MDEGLETRRTYRESTFAEINKVLDEARGYDGTAQAAEDVTFMMFNLAANELGLTGFQASFVLLNLLWKGNGWKGPGTVIKAEDNLYPQYPHPTDKVAEWFDSEEVQDYLTREAQRLLDERGDRPIMSEKVAEHWQALAGRTTTTPAP